MVIGEKVELRERSKIIPGSPDLELDLLVLPEIELVILIDNLLRILNVQNQNALYQ